MRLQKVLWTVMILAVSSPADAQRVTADIEGEVNDEQRLPLAAASVIVRNEDTGFERSVVTNGSGRYLIRALPVEGEYEIRAAHAGFATVVEQHLTLFPNQSRVIDFTLTVGNYVESITVLGGAPLIDTVQSTVQQTVEEELVRSVPLFGRNFLNLASLAAGFTGNPSFPGVDGQIYSANNVMVDGASHFSKWRSAARTYYSGYGLESIKEVQVLTNRFSAEFGDGLATVTSAVTKSGTNNFHGTALIYFQNDAFNASPWNAATKPPLNFEQYGFSLGGPVARDKTHFFASYEGRRQRSNAVVTAPASFGQVVPQDQDEHLGFFKLDHQVTPRQLLTARYNGQWFSWHNEYGGLNLPGTGDRYNNDVHTAFLMDTMQLSPRLLNELRFQFARYTDIRTDLDPSVRIVRTGYSIQGGMYGPLGAGATPEDTYEGSDLVSYWRGSHGVKMGGGFKYVGATNPQLPAGNAMYLFAGPPNEFPNPVSFTQAFAMTAGSAVAKPRSWAFFGFAQDDVTVRPNLTLNLGLRYDIEDVYNIRNFQAPVDKNNVQPRAGVAWDPTGHGTTVFRGGIGLYNQQHLFFYLNRAQLQGADGAVTFVLPFGDPQFPIFPNILPAIPPGAILPPRDIWRVDPHLGNPYSVQATVGIERKLLSGTVLAVDYVYLRGVDLLGAIDSNAPASVPPGARRTVAEADATRPLVPVPDGFRKILTLTNMGQSWYYGLQIKLTRTSGRLHTMVSYTFSRAEDMLNPSAPPMDSRDIQGDKALSSNDQRHNLVGAADWRLPGTGRVIGDWSVSGVFEIRDGRPYTITYGGDRYGTTQNDARPGSRNTAKTAGFDNLDLALGRVFRTGHEKTIQARFETFNVFNQTNYNGYVGSLSSPLFGQPVSAFDKRRVQLALVYRF